ncbi:TPA: serine--tRNA ligase [Candidatus Dojkabacteria bacterium]|uniref:Serine--tRNA ligase n=1 Tax=Candidatus Dojkabacteria bacterium TaxID=2099670 RepID=A0A832RCB6_9BACT|nr:serine--tRNA ligase [Candidatus Dojkabacteria bacterium]
MLDIKRIVEHKEEVQRGLLKRMNPEDFNLGEIISLYENKKSLQTEFDTKRAEQNSFNERMAKEDKGSDAFKELVKELKELSEEVKEIETRLKEADEKLKSKLEVLPNVPDEDVVSGGKENNEVVKEVGRKPEYAFAIRDHVELGVDLGIFDFETASKVSGNNFSMYRGLGAQLEWALINYFISTHLDNGYEMIIPPNLVVRESAYTAGQLPKFEDDVYWVQDGLCLIPTSETVLTNIYRGDILNESDLPKKFFAYTPCYRREAGSYRANEKGLIRMHQFNKVEMFQYTSVEKSKESFEEMLNIAEELVAGLGLHYRVVKLAAGDCSAGMARTYDVEVYIPSMDTYYEVSSVSNSKDYQARRGNMRYKKADGKIEFLHTLNGSGLATSRLMVGLIETYQNEDGSVTIPEVLRPFMNGLSKISK